MSYLGAILCLVYVVDVLPYVIEGVHIVITCNPTLARVRYRYSHPLARFHTFSELCRKSPLRELYTVDDVFIANRWV